MSDAYKTLDEYNALTIANHLITGYGPETTVHMPCPFCCAPHFLCHGIMDTQKALSHGATCKHCGRGCKVVFEQIGPHAMEFQFVQTCGDEPPAAMPWRMRRVS